MATTLKQIADVSGVSFATVSRVLKGKGAFSSETRDRVFAMAKRMNYRPNQAAQALVTGRTNLIALHTMEWHKPAFSNLARAFQLAVETDGYHLLLTDQTPQGRGDSGSAYWRCDGSVFMEMGLPSEFFDAEGRQMGNKPFVGMGVSITRQGDYVRSELLEPAIRAVEHLIVGGRRRIAYLVNASSQKVSDPRNEAYRKTIASAGREVIEIVSAEQDRPTARQAVRDYVRAHGHPDAIFCHTDDLALGAYRALHDLGLSVPKDVALVGCDGLSEGEYLDCPLTTLVPPHTESAAMAWRFLKNRIDEPLHSPQQKTIPFQLVVRESSKSVS